MKNNVMLDINYNLSKQTLLSDKKRAAKWQLSNMLY